MIIYDAKNYLGILCSFRASSLNSVRWLVVSAICWAVFVVKFLETCEHGKSTVSLPSLSGIATVAGVMLAMQAATSFARFQDGLELAVTVRSTTKLATRPPGPFWPRLRCFSFVFMAWYNLPLLQTLICALGGGGLGNS